MPRITPSLIQLIGDGFVDDAYAADGNHLRWIFDPRLGFPRFAFCLERRPGLGTEQALVDAALFVESFSESTAPVSEIVRPGVSVSRPGGTMAISSEGIILKDQPLVFDFHGGSDGDPEPYACWVRPWRNSVATRKSRSWPARITVTFYRRRASVLHRAKWSSIFSSITRWPKRSLRSQAQQDKPTRHVRIALGCLRASSATQPLSGTSVNLKPYRPSYSMVEWKVFDSQQLAK